MFLEMNITYLIILNCELLGASQTLGLCHGHSIYHCLERRKILILFCDFMWFQNKRKICCKMTSDVLKVSRRLSDDLENWMQNLNSDVKRCIPIINLAIPGSHDSMSYGINRR